jgi:hypothetical protein
MTIPLVGNIQTNDPKLDRLPEFDQASRSFPARALLSEDEQQKPIRSFTWNLPGRYLMQPLDQGSEGACVGFGWANELAARPFPDNSISDADAMWIYHRAQDLDEWPGSDYSGTSVLAGAKAVLERGGLVEYRWAFNLDDLKRTVAYHGPAVLGLNWYTGMMRPDSDGRIRPTGDIEGGHCILFPRVRGPKFSIRRYANTNWLWNSWGRNNGWPWGYLTDDDLDRLLHEQGEACIPVIRKRSS